MKLYLPRTARRREPGVFREAAERWRREAILVVEDEAMVRTY